MSWYQYVDWMSNWFFLIKSLFLSNHFFFIIILIRWLGSKCNSAPPQLASLKAGWAGSPVTLGFRTLTLISYARDIRSNDHWTKRRPLPFISSLKSFKVRRHGRPGFLYGCRLCILRDMSCLEIIHDLILCLRITQRETPISRPNFQDFDWFVRLLFY